LTCFKKKSPSFQWTLVKLISKDYFWKDIFHINDPKVLAMKKDEPIQMNTQGWQNLEMMRQLNGYLPHHYRLNVERIEELLIEIEGLRGNSMAFQQINHFGLQLSAQVDPLLSGVEKEVELNIEPMMGKAHRASEEGESEDNTLTRWSREDKEPIDVESEEWLREVYHFHLDLIENYERIVKSYRPIIKDMVVIESFVTKKVAQLMCLFPEAEEMFHKMYGKRSESYKILKKEINEFSTAFVSRAV
jgi:hypothetical protein